MLMVFSKLLRYYHTIRYLTWTQLYYQVKYKIKYRVLKHRDLISLKVSHTAVDLNLFQNIADSNYSYSVGNCFTFLNQTKCFSGTVDWDWQGYGKLWTYHLNYFDFLHSDALDTEHKISTIHRYIDAFNTLQNAQEPYTISLRNINIIKFVCANKITDYKINSFLYQTYLILIKRLEYHILGNHLLENAFSLYIGAFFFHEHIFLAKAKRLLQRELQEQILADGAHFELTPSYQKILLVRVLDCLNVTSQSSFDNTLSSLLGSTASRMLAWLANVTFKNGDVPWINDTSSENYSNFDQVSEYAARLKIDKADLELNDSGFRMKRKQDYEVFLDYGSIAASYIPAHSHADIFNFVLVIRNIPVIIDPGISTYEDNEARHRERSTGYHNTVTVNGDNQSDVWSSFRVGKRAAVFNVQENAEGILGSHDGYVSRYGVVHTRQVICEENTIKIKDVLSRFAKAQAHLHFHPDQRIAVTGTQIIGVGFIIEVTGMAGLLAVPYTCPVAFNKVTQATKIIIDFNTSLETTIQLT